MNVTECGVRYRMRLTSSRVMSRAASKDWQAVQCSDIYAHYACVADCADAMADAWENTAGCAHADCLHGNILK